MARIIVTDGDQRAALAVVRSLGKAGHTVMVVATQLRSLAAASRFSSGSSALPDPLESPLLFAQGILSLLDRWPADLLIPITDAALMAVTTVPELGKQVTIPFAGREAIGRAADKSLLMELAPRAGIAVPRQLKASSPEELGNLDSDQLLFPLVIKPSRSVFSEEGVQHKARVLHAANVRELRERGGSVARQAYPVLLQQRIVGPGIGIFLLVWNGDIKGVFSHRRIREKPPSGGVSVYRESIAADPGLVAKSRALLEMIGWQGVAMIEYKVDEATGTPFLMEINGRFWGSLQLAIDSGIDFPGLLVRLARGEQVQSPPAYRVGIRSRWWWGDVDHLLAMLRRSPAQLSLTPGAPGRLATIAEFAKVWRPGDRSEVLRWSDPKPFIRETINWFKGQ
jgi:predicted ATP-grasp superfamily ATP-dependent carboligase